MFSTHRSNFVLFYTMLLKLQLRCKGQRQTTLKFCNIEIDIYCIGNTHSRTAFVWTCLCLHMSYMFSMVYGSAWRSARQKSEKNLGNVISELLPSLWSNKHHYLSFVLCIQHDNYKPSFLIDYLIEVLKLSNQVTSLTTKFYKYNDEN